MTENTSVLSVKFTERKDHTEMTAIAEAAALIRRVAGYRKPDESLKAVFLRVARKLSSRLPKYIGPMKPGRVEDIWREEARMIRSEEMDALRALAAEHKATEEAARDEFKALERRIEAIERTLGLSPAHVAGARHLAMVGALGDLDRALDGGAR
ncbi:MAG: hypothetical protein M9937_26420 [Chelatococcus sp.]|uniref:hypothetical protein n=1 Tax=Chelatococcus sp. TaxID=1953771 RepID=UPI0026088F5C|nr:hypothetical protein [Chelatococcus sp.]MCO5079208.1 hypothetical protein [Chelatococcus sp.]